MLSFKQLSEKKTKIKINPKKEELMGEGNYSKGGKVKKEDCAKCHGKGCDHCDDKGYHTEAKKKDDSYLETDFKKRQKNNEKARKDLMKGPQMKNPHFESTEDAYVSQEEVSEESTEEIAETETFLTFGQYQHALTLDEEQLNEFLKGLFGGGSKPASSGSGQMPSHAGLASKLGQRRQMLNKAMGKTDTKVLGFSKGGKVKKEEVEEVEETVLPGSQGSSAGRTYDSKKDFKQAFKSNPGAFKSALPGGMSNYFSRGKPGNHGYQPPSSSTSGMGMPVGLQKSMFNSGLGQKLSGGSGFWKSTMKANNIKIDKPSKSKGGKVKKEEVEVQEGRAEDAKKSLDAVKKRQGVLDNYEKKTGTKLDISKTPEHKAHKQNFPGAKRTGKKVKGAKETDLQKHNRRVQTYTDRLKKYGKTTKQKRDDDAMSKQTSRYD